MHEDEGQYTLHYMRADADVLWPLIDVELSIVPHLARSFFEFGNVLDEFPNCNFAIGK